MFASIHVPDFQVEAIVRHQPELRQHAVAIIDGKPPLCTVSGVNGRARHAGIEIGMTKSQVEQFFEATVLQRSPAQENSAHAALLDCGAAFSPRVEDTAQDTVVIDVKGLVSLFGSSSDLAAAVAKNIEDLGLVANVAIASNPDAAICAAQGWSGITVIPAGTEAASLQNLSIAVLPLDDEQHATLIRWGIHTFGALARLPAKALAERLGQTGVRLRQLARGIATRPVTPVAPLLRFEEAIELEDSIETLEPLFFILNRLADAVFNRLRSRGLAALELHLTLQRETSRDPYLLTLRLPVPASNPRIATRLFMLELESHPPGAAITAISLEAISSKPRIVQTGLFVPLSPEPEKLELTLARIAAIVGSENVGSPRLEDTWERQRFQMKHGGLGQGGDDDDGGQHPLAPSPPRSPRLRPPEQTHLRPVTNNSKAILLKVFRPIIEATVNLSGRQPDRLACAKVYGRIESASGPWHSSGNWWGCYWSRDEWDVAVRSAADSRIWLLRIFRNTLNNRWYAEGFYD